MAEQPERHGHPVPFDLREVPEEVRAVAGECERLWERALHSAHHQFAASMIWRSMHRWLSVLAAAVGALAGVSAVADLIGARVAGVGALLAAVIGGATSLLAPDQHAAQCTISGNAYVEIRDASQQMLCVDLVRLDYDTARQRLADLTTGLHAANRVAEPTSFLARWYARRALKSGIANDDVWAARTRRR
ncbi:MULTISPECIES: SLATT domain-containing protein [Streptomyces]|uniref:SLATT domain-containing protein n=1 Tax=Streptomyces TaxID=1883 RepID=UPI003320A462